MTDFDERGGEPAIPGECKSYTCPGELYSIPRSIHLARLASFYSSCRDCEHRFDTGHFLPDQGTLPHGQEYRSTRVSVVSEESVRGVYLNELDRNRSVLWGEVLADYLWDQQPLIARREPMANSQIIADQSLDEPPTNAHGPTVVVGFDERPSSPDIVTGAVLGLRRMGCPVIDLGQTTLPTLAFNVQELEAAELFVTGSGCDPSSGIRSAGSQGASVPRGTDADGASSENGGWTTNSKNRGLQTLSGTTDVRVELGFTLSCTQAVAPRLRDVDAPAAASP